MKALCSTGRKSQKPVFIIHLIWPVHSVVFQVKHPPLTLSRPNKCSPATSERQMLGLTQWGFPQPRLIGRSFIYDLERGR